MRTLQVGLTTILLSAVSVGSTTPAASMPDHYDCIVRKIYGLNDDATITTKEVYASTMIGSKFSVSRLSGKIVGEVLPTLIGNPTMVIYHGDTENAFKTVAFFDKQVQVLEVQEFRPGATKPFVSLSMGGAGIVTGECT